MDGQDLLWLGWSTAGNSYKISPYPEREDVRIESDS